MPHIGNFPIPGYPKPVTVHACAFVPQDDTVHWLVNNAVLYNRDTLTTQYFRAPVFFPNKATITKLTLFGFREDALATMRIVLYEVATDTVRTTMATIVADWTDGFGSKSETTITSPTIDNSGNSYMLELQLDPNDDALDVRLAGVQIEWK